MPIPNNPPLMPSVLGENADTLPIGESSSPGSGALSYADGWPPAVSMALKAGGIAPKREWFNAIYKLFSEHLYFLQSGGVYPWSEILNYRKGCRIMGSDGIEYLAQKPSGPDTPDESGEMAGPIDPVGDETGTWLDQSLDAIVKRIADPWNLFPLRAPLAVGDLRFSYNVQVPQLDAEGNQLTDEEGNPLFVTESRSGRHPVMPGESLPRENWLICDGGDDGLGGKVPDLRGRMILGADASHAAGSAGGSTSYGGSISGTAAGNTNNTTISMAQSPSHNHGFTASLSNVTVGLGNLAFGTCGAGVSGGGTDWRGSSNAHAHYSSLPVSGSASVSGLPPYYALAYIMRVS